MASGRSAVKVWFDIATYALVGVVVAIDVEDRQNVDIHLVEQAGHLRVAAISGQSLRRNEGRICQWKPPYKPLMPMQLSSLPL